MEIKNEYDVIEYYKDDAISFMKDYKVYCSITLSIAIDAYQNNINIVDFKDFIICKLAGLNILNNSFINPAIFYRNIIKYNKDKKYADTLMNIIESFALTDIDVNALYDLNIITNKNKIDVICKPFIDNYKVKRNKDNRVILTTNNLDEATRVCIKDRKSAVYNSKNEKVYGVELPKEDKTSKIKRANEFNKYEQNSLVTLNKANLYENSDSKSPLRSISGIYRIASDKMKNNRYSIRNEYGVELGYINYKDIK